VIYPIDQESVFFMENIKRINKIFDKGQSKGRLLTIAEEISETDNNMFEFN